MAENGRGAHAQAYLREAERTLAVARLARDGGYWAPCVKDAFDAMEQAVAALIAGKDERIPKKHTGKITLFIRLYRPEDDLGKALLFWARLRDRARYVDLRDGRYVAPSDLFDEDDARKIIPDAELVLAFARENIRSGDE